MATPPDLSAPLAGFLRGVVVGGGVTEFVGDFEGVAEDVTSAAVVCFAGSVAVVPLPDNCVTVAFVTPVAKPELAVALGADVVTFAALVELAAVAVA